MQRMKKEKRLKEGAARNSSGFRALPKKEAAKCIRDIQKELRPYEKCEALGAQALSDAELLAVILRTGSRGQNAVSLSEAVLSMRTDGEGLLGLMHLGFSELCALPGIGRVKALQLLCVCELSKRISQKKAQKRLAIRSASSVADLLMEELRHLEQECVYALFLDARGLLRRKCLLASGSMQAVAITPREIFLQAVRCGAASFILAHNHPSGEPAPSEADLSLTEKLRAGGEALGIPLLDHIIIGDCCYFSFLEEGRLSDKARASQAPSQG